MEADRVAQRCALFCLSRRHPEWTYAELAAHVGRSERWVNTWLARLKHATTPDLTLVQSHSHVRHTPPPSTPQPVVEQLLAPLVGSLREQEVPWSSICRVARE